MAFGTIKADTIAFSDTSNSGAETTASVETLVDNANNISTNTTNITANTNAIALKAPLDSPALTGTPTSTTAAAGTNNTQIATTAYADNAASVAAAGVVSSAPAALDTLNELAAALGDDANFSTTVTNSIATKLPLAGGTLTGDLTLSGDPDAALKAATKQYVDANKGASLGLAIALG